MMSVIRVLLIIAVLAIIGFVLKRLVGRMNPKKGRGIYYVPRVYVCYNAIVLIAMVFICVYMSHLEGRWSGAAIIFYLMLVGSALHVCRRLRTEIVIGESSVTFKMLRRVEVPYESIRFIRSNQLSNMPFAEISYMDKGRLKKFCVDKDVYLFDELIGRLSDKCGLAVKKKRA